MINTIFNVIGKKHNQTSVSDADREMPTLRSMDNAGNSVNLVSSIIRLPSGWDFSVCIRGGVLFPSVRVIFFLYETGDPLQNTVVLQLHINVQNTEESINKY